MSDKTFARKFRGPLYRVKRRRVQLGIAARLRRPLKSVQARRLEMGLAHFGAQGPWSKQEESLLGKLSDKTFARKFGRPLHLWTHEEDALLGTIPDPQVAARLRLTTGAVAHRRRRLGRPVRFAHRRPWTPEEDALLGTASDTEIAARLGRKIAVVCIRRQKLDRFSA